MGQSTVEYLAIVWDSVPLIVSVLFSTFSLSLKVSHCDLPTNINGKGKVHHTPLRERRGVLISLS